MKNTILIILIIVLSIPAQLVAQSPVFNFVYQSASFKTNFTDKVSITASYKTLKNEAYNHKKKDETNKTQKSKKHNLIDSNSDFPLFLAFIVIVLILAGLVWVSVKYLDVDFSDIGGYWG